MQKAGTSWWFDLIVDHPKVDGPPFKELHYFSPLYNSLTEQTLADYHRYFPRREGHLTGEWTPRYVVDAWSLHLLAQAAPDTRILVMLRDPLDRFQSGVTHDMSRGAPDNGLVVTGHVDRSDYVSQLRNLFTYFDRDNVLILQYEQCRADIAGQLARTHRFLGLDVVAPVDPGRQVNATVVDKSPVADHLAEALTRRFQAMRDPMLELAPDLDMTLWPSMSTSPAATN